MSSTEGGRAVGTAAAGSARLIRTVFDAELMPLAAKLRAAGRAPFPPGPDASQTTYYQTRRHTAMRREDFEVFGPGSITEFEAALARLWISQGWTELAPLAPSLARVAQAVYFVEDRDDEVSPFMYVMF